MLTNEYCKDEMIKRGLRIKNIRENELHMTKVALAHELGISGQFIGLVEEGKGNLMYGSLKKLRELSNHSADFILFGLDDDVLNQTKKHLQRCSEVQLVNALNILTKLAFFIRNE